MDGNGLIYLVLFSWYLWEVAKDCYGPYTSQEKSIKFLVYLSGVMIVLNIVIFAVNLIAGAIIAIGTVVGG